MLIEEDGWEGTVVAKNRVRMCVWVIEMEERRDSGRIAWGRRRRLLIQHLGWNGPTQNNKTAFLPPLSGLRTLFYSILLV